MSSHFLFVQSKCSHGSLFNQNSAKKYFLYFELMCVLRAGLKTSVRSNRSLPISGVALNKSWSNASKGGTKRAAAAPKADGDSAAA